MVKPASGTGFTVQDPRTKGVDIVDNEGNIVDHVPYGTGGATGVSGEPIYQDETSKEWSTTPPVSISLNQQSGNIRVVAPKDVYESEAFQEIFPSSDLEAISRAYKANPAIQVEDSEGNMVGIPEIVKRLDQDAKKFAENLTKEAAVKSLVRGAIGEQADNLNREQIITMGTSGDLENKNETEATIAIPKSISSMFPNLKELKTFSNDIVSQGDFFENFYNLEKSSKEDLVKLKKTIDSYFEGGDFSDLDEFSKMYALRDFVNTYEPEVGFWQSEGLKWSAFGEGAARATAGFTASAISIVQGASDLLVNTQEKALQLLMNASGQEYTPQKPSEVKWDLINTGIGAVFGTEDLNEELAAQYKERSEYYYALNRSAATTFMLSNLATSVAENVIAGKAIGNIIGNLASLNAVAKGADQVAEAVGAGKILYSAEGTVQAYTGWNAIMNQLVGTPNPSLWQTLKVLSSTDTAKFFAGTKATISGLSAVSGPVATSKLAKAITSTAKILKRGELVATGANFLAQVTLDTTLASPTAMRRIISGEAKDEDKQVYLREVAWNAAGYGAGILIGKAMTTFAKTKVGDAANAWASQKMASAKTVFHDMSDSVKSKVWGEDWLSNIKNPGKKQVARYNEIIAEANRKIANATGDLGSTSYAASQTQAVKEAKAQAIAVQNAIDNQEAGLRYYMNLYTGGSVEDASKTYYPALSEALRQATANETALAKQLEELKISTSEKPTALVNGTATNLNLPQDVVNYPNDLYSVEYLNRKLDLQGLSDAEAKGLEIAQARIDAFEKKYPKKLVEFIKEQYLPSLYKAYAEINIHRQEAHIESEANRIGLRESRLFGDEGDRWIHMQAVTDFQRDAVNNANRLSTQLSGFAEVDDIPELFHYSWGSAKDYVHPQLALQNYLWQTAVAENARNTWQDISPIYKEKTELLISGEKGEAAQTFQNLKRNLGKISKLGISGIVEDLSVNDAISSVVQDMANKKAFERAERKVISAQEKVEKLTVDEIKISAKDKLSAILSLPDATIAEIIGDSPTSSIGLTEESWDAFIDSANTKTRKGILGCFKEQQALTGFEEKRGKANFSWANYKNTLQFDADLNTKIDRIRVQNDKAYLDSPIVEKIAQEQKRARLLFDATTTLEKSLAQLNLPTANDKFEAVLSAQKAVQGFKNYVLSDSVGSQIIDAIAVEVAPENMDLAKDYIALKVLEKNKKRLEIELIKMFNKEKFADVFKKSNPRQIERYKEAVVGLVINELENELNDSRNLLKASGETIVDEDDVMAEIKSLVKEIDELSNEEAVVSVYNDEGKLELFRTDPVLADLYNYRPIIQPTKAEIFFGNSVFRTMNRVARFFQTTANPKSYKNQFFRDFGSAYFSTGSYQAMGMISKDLQSAYGQILADKLVEDMKITSPSTYEFLQTTAKEQGVSIQTLAIQRYMSFGKITSPAETPTSFYREPYESSDSFAATLKQTKNKLAEIADKLLSWAETPNQAREVYLRNATYAKGLQDGLEAGMSVRDAQNMAQFFQRNATTNFSRQLYHFRMFQKTVNYFGAGVNGFTSFWRLFSLDPVGMATRIFGGLVMPTIVATVATLANEENREKYIHLPEYSKKEQFVFMMNGEIYRIPIPQELDIFVAPVRQAVETMYDGNRNSFIELMLSDALSIAPIDFSALTMLDRDRLMNDAPSFLDRTKALGLDLIDQTMPNALKLPFQAVTGIDTYTGERIDNSYYMIDDEGNRILVGGTASKFALRVAELTGASPSVIAHITESLVGQVGNDILDVVFGGESVESLAENTVSGLTSFQTADYNLVRSEWNNAIADLWAEKEDTYLPAYVDYSKTINLTTDPAEKEKLRAKRQDAIQPFLDKVKTVVGNLKSSYGGSYDRFRFASVVSLLTFDTGTTSSNTNEARLASRSTFYDNRNNAYLWMTANGLNASMDRSILGYITKNEEGENVIKYNTPTGILTMRDAIYGVADRDIANLQTLLDDAQIKRGEMFGSNYEAAKAQGKATLKEYKATWNARVVQALAPYIRSRGVSSVLDNVATRDLLDNYIFVDNPYKTKEYLNEVFGN